MAAVPSKKTQGKVKTAPRRSMEVTAPGKPRARTGDKPAKRLPGEPRLLARGEIARGGMGVVHRVFDTRMERTTALKVIDPELGTNAEMVARFFDEARITGLLDHP